MATITGSTGSTITTVNVGSNDQNGTASALSAAISAALRAGTLTQAGTGTAQTPVYTEYQTPGTIPLNAAQTATVINTTGPATVIGSGSLGADPFPSRAFCSFASAALRITSKTHLTSSAFDDARESCCRSRGCAGAHPSVVAPSRWRALRVEG